MPVARKTDPLTSHEAAATVHPSTIKVLRAGILAILSTGPKTDAEIGIEWDEGWLNFASPSGLRTRRKELVDEGLVIDTGQRQQLPSGRWATVWGLPGSSPKCRQLLASGAGKAPGGPCGRDLVNPISSATMLEGRCPVHGWQTIPL